MRYRCLFQSFSHTCHRPVAKLQEKIFRFFLHLFICLNTFGPIGIIEGSDYSKKCEGKKKKSWGSNFALGSWQLKTVKGVNGVFKQSMINDRYDISRKVVPFQSGSWDEQMYEMH